MADNEGRYPNRNNVLASWLGKAGTGGYGAEGLQADDRPLNTYVGGPYSASAQVYEASCPRDLTTRVYLGTPDSNYNYEGASYQGNIPNGSAGGSWNQAYRGLIESGNRGRKASDVVDASRMVSIAEVGAYVASWWPASTWISGGEAYNWHKLNAWNIAFADGGARSTIVVPQSFTNELYTFDYQY